MQVLTRNHRWTLMLVAGALVFSGSIARADEVDRIREKAIELHRDLFTAQFQYAAEGKQSNLARVYKDFDYLLKDNKTKTISQAASAAKDPALQSRLQRLHDFLMGERIRASVAVAWDNARNYDRSSAMSVAGVDGEVTVNSFESMLAGEESRSNRRNVYLASRELRENSNVFLLNLGIDLDRQAQQLVGKDYDTFLAEQYAIDPAEIEALAQQILDSTQAEYERLLSEVVAAAMPEMSVSELREYDIPYLLRMPHLSETFPQGGHKDVAQRWLADLGLDLKSARNFKISDEARAGRSPVPATFPIANGNDTRISIPSLGGVSDYWNLFGQLGSGLFHYHIAPALEFADAKLGSPVLPFLYGALFQDVLTIPEWRAKYLQGGDPAQVEAALQFRKLLDLRDAAGRYLYYRKMYADSKTPPSAYTELMQRARHWHQGAAEESNYLLADDQHRSGMKLLAAVRAAQLRAKLAEQFGDSWWSRPEAGAWLKAEWSKGFSRSPQELVNAWGLGAADASVLSR